jgi:nucleotide-binding universal stress UspA family protein
MALIHRNREMGADVIIMGSQGHVGIRRGLIGSVSDFVVIHAHRPVQIFRESRRDVRITILWLK